MEKALREVVKLLINNSMLLSLQEKRDVSALTPLLNRQELTELFELLLGSKRRTEHILDDLAAVYPGVIKDLEGYQVNALKTIFKDERDFLKISVNQQQ